MSGVSSSLKVKTALLGDDDALKIRRHWFVARSARAADRRLRRYAASRPEGPDFTLPSQDGSPISLSQFKGKWVVLYFYPKDMTPGCTIEAHNFQRDISKYESANAVIVGVSVDTTDSHKEFCAQQGLTFKLLADHDKKVVEEYGSTMSYGGAVIASRNTFLIDPEGKIRKEWVKVDPRTHSAEVLSTLQSLEGKS